MGSSNGNNIMVKTYLTKQPLTTNFINQKSRKQSFHLRFLWHTMQLSNPPSDNDIVARSCFSFDMLYSIVNSPQRFSFTLNLTTHGPQFFPFLIFLLPWSSILTLYFCLKFSSLVYLFLNSIHVLFVLTVPVCLSVLHVKERERVCVCERKACLTASVL